MSATTSATDHSQRSMEPDEDQPAAEQQHGQQHRQLELAGPLEAPRASSTSTITMTELMASYATTAALSCPRTPRSRTG